MAGADAAYWLRAADADLHNAKGSDMMRAMFRRLNLPRLHCVDTAAPECLVKLAMPTKTSVLVAAHASATMGQSQLDGHANTATLVNEWTHLATE